MTELLVEDEDTFVTNTRKLEDGEQGVRSALGVLRDYNGGGVEVQTSPELGASQAVTCRGERHFRDQQA